MEEREIIECSVIIPVYNVEKYLKSCLESVIIQEQNYIEIICVDDASTDSSYDILCEYQRRDSRIQVYRLPSNMGLAHVRNYGCERAKGKYILFLDSDDRLSNTAISHLMKIVSKKEYDMVFFGYKSVYESLEIKKMLGTKYPGRINSYEGEWNGSDLFCELYSKGELSLNVWAQMYRRSFLENNEIKFVDGILHEDIPYTTVSVLSADKVYYTNEICYFWLHRYNSITSCKTTPRHIEGRVIGILNIISFLEKSSVLEQHYEILKKFIDKLCFDIKYQYDRLESDERIFNNDCFHKLIFNMLFMSEKQNRIKKSCIEKIAESEEIIIYGAGKIAAITINYVNTIGKRIVGIVVTQKADNSEWFYGHPVQEIEELNDKKNALVCVALSKRYFGEIENRLIEHGFKNIILVELETIVL